MGYSLNSAAVNRVQKFLQILKETKDDQVTWQTPAPKRFQFYLHCGLIAGEATEDPEFKDLKKEWKIRTKGALVIAQRRVLKSPSSVIQVGQSSNFYDVITELSSNSNSMTFEAQLNDEELEKLRKWCISKEATFSYKEGNLSVLR
jgi:hypothetical protein